MGNEPLPAHRLHVLHQKQRQRDVKHVVLCRGAQTALQAQHQRVPGVEGRAEEGPLVLARQVEDNVDLREVGVVGDVEVTLRGGREGGREERKEGGREGGKRGRKEGGRREGREEGRREGGRGERRGRREEKDERQQESKQKSKIECQLEVKQESKLESRLESNA